MAFCIKCGTQLVDGANFCAKCGTPSSEVLGYTDTPSKGKLKFTDGSYYEGEYINYKPNGIGKKTFANGDVQEGRFENGEFVG